jgi:hypothetical protein
MTADQSAAQSGDRKLSDAERNHILDQAVDAARDRPVKNRVGRTFFVSHKPKIDRSTFSAEIVWGKTLTDPLIIVLLAVLSVICGVVVLPYWLFLSLRPNKFDRTVFIDEYGHEQWGIAPIHPAQRVLSVALAIATVWYVIYMINLVQH